MTEEHTAPARGIRSKRTIVVAAVVLAAVVLGGAGLGRALSEAGASAPAPASPTAACGGSSPKLTVQGTGEASGTPDELNAVFSFSTTAGTSAAALTQNNGEVDQAITALTGTGVAKADLQTTALNLAPQYAYPHGVPTLTGYLVSESLQATLRNVSTAGTAVDSVVNAAGDATQIQSLTFAFGKPAAVQDQARVDAVTQAKSHAEAMAASADRRLGVLCSLTDNTQPTSPLSYQSLNAVAASGAPSAVPLAPGTQVQTDQVTLVYALESR